jgi:predicted methyltransferase
MRQQDVIGLVEAHGFDLVATSEINANPRDPADHPAGVWELLPVQRTKREELKAIGESDRMTLLFRKRD